MDLAPAMREGVVELRDGLRAFADKKGWAPKDYRIFMNVNKVWGSYNVELLARDYDNFGGWDEAEQRRALDELCDFLMERLRDHRDLYDAMNLYTRGPTDDEWRPGFDPGESIAVIPDDFLNPELHPSRSGMQGNPSGF